MDTENGEEVDLHPDMTELENVFMKHYAPNIFKAARDQVVKRAPG